MGRAVYEASRRAREIFDEADRILGYRLSAICFEGPRSAQRQSVAQPAVLTTSVAILEARGGLGGVAPISDGSEPRGVAALPADVIPAFVAGHSLGEYTALVAAGVLTFGEALRLVAERGRLAAGGAEGAMAAVLGMSAATVERIINATVPTGAAVVANDNGPAQVTIAGDEASLTKVSAALTAAGARKVVPLRISARSTSRRWAGSAPSSPRSCAADLAGPGRADRRERVGRAAPARPHPGDARPPPRSASSGSGRSATWPSARLTFVELGAGQVVNGLVKRIADVKLVNISDPIRSARAARATPGAPA